MLRSFVSRFHKMAAMLSCHGSKAVLTAGASTSRDNRWCLRLVLQHEEQEEQQGERPRGRGRGVQSRRRGARARGRGVQSRRIGGGALDVPNG